MKWQTNSHSCGQILAKICKSVEKMNSITDSKTLLHTKIKSNLDKVCRLINLMFCALKLPSVFI